MISYHHMPPVGAVDFTMSINVIEQGFPAEWVRKYVSEELYLIDPIPKTALQIGRWFLWDEVRDLTTLTKDNLRYLELLRSADFGQGMAIPVFGPSGRDGYLGIGFGHDELPQPQTMNCLALIAQTAHLRYCQLIKPRNLKLAALSKREQEVLSWVVRGKSNSVIADLTGLSAHTVDAHLRKAYRKLDAHDRVTASLRALATGAVY